MTATTTKAPTVKRSRWVFGLAIFGILFGLLTIVSGGAALFNAKAQQLAGDYVGFVLWFNILAGYSYVIVIGGATLGHVAVDSDCGGHAAGFHGIRRAGMERP